MDDKYLIEYINEKGLESEIVRNMIGCTIDKKVSQLLSENFNTIIDSNIDNIFKKNIEIDGVKYKSLKDYVQVVVSRYTKSINVEKLIKEKVYEAVYDSIRGYDNGY